VTKKADEPFTEKQLEELRKLAPRVDHPDTPERFKQAMRKVFGVSAPKPDVKASEEPEQTDDCGDDSPPATWGD
jgi:hypothetical protein